MEKKTSQNLVEREKNKKGDGTISKVQLWTCYAASAVIVILCVPEARKSETQASGKAALYCFLAALRVLIPYLSLSTPPRSGD